MERCHLGDDDKGNGAQPDGEGPVI
jgi:hypothetical protein